MRFPKTDQDFIDLEERRSFIKMLTALTGASIITSAELLRAQTPSVQGDAKNSDPAWGALKGRISFAGEVPERKEVDLSQSALNAADLKWFKSLGPILNEDWVVNPLNKGVQWVYVWLIPESKRGALVSHESLTVIPEGKKLIPIDQEPTGYVPHAVAIQQGQGILMRNKGPVSHVFNLTAFSNTAMNAAMPPSKEIPVTNLQAERSPIIINCPPHPWERMTLRVFDHPYFAVTNKEGEFEFTMVPKGPCRLVVWHESLGFHGGREGRFGSIVNVEGGAVTDLGEIKVNAEIAS